MKYCSHCGAQIDDQAEICIHCGCRVARTQSGGGYSAISIVGFVLAFIFPLAGLVVSIVANNSAKKAEDEGSRNFSKYGIIISAVIMILEVVIVVLYICLVIGMVAASMGMWAAAA